MLYIDPECCSYCGVENIKIVHQYFPNIGGGYRIGGSYGYVEHACKKCASGYCEYCNQRLPRYCFIECGLCNKRHCYNNSDMKYDPSTIFGRKYKLCDAHKDCTTVYRNHIGQKNIFV